LVVAIASGCGHEAAPPPPRPLAVDLVTLTPTEVVDASEYLGRLRSRTSATLQPQVDGQITEILVHPGELVEAGQPLVRIDPGRQPAAVEQAQANRAARAAQLQLAERNFERVEHLVARGAAPEQDLDNARAALEAARGDVQASGAEIASNRVQLDYYRIVAPTHGVIGDIPARVGDRVTAQTVITTVTDNRVLEANVSIPVERARAVKLGTAIVLVDDRGHELGRGQVGFISPQVNPETQSVLVKANIRNPAGRLRADEVARARVVWATHPGLVVPALAVTRQGGQAFVFVATVDGARLVAKQRPVQLGELANDEFVVTSGLAAGDRVVVSAIQKLHDGTAIAKAEAPSREARPAPPHG
jgi:RND family efflux transporter MFP subunit